MTLPRFVAIVVLALAALTAAPSAPAQPALETAKAFGLTIPPSVLARADAIVQP